MVVHTNKDDLKIKKHLIHLVKENKDPEITKQILEMSYPFSQPSLLIRLNGAFYFLGIERNYCFSFETVRAAILVRVLCSTTVLVLVLLVTSGKGDVLLTCPSLALVFYFLIPKRSGPEMFFNCII